MKKLLLFIVSLISLHAQQEPATFSSHTQLVVESIVVTDKKERRWRA
jgi:hypothetical protein